MNAIIRSMACTDCDHGKNFFKIFERSKLGEQGNVKKIKGKME